MLLRVLGSFVLLLAVAGVTGCEQGPTEVKSPEFRAAQGDMSEFQLMKIHGSESDIPIAQGFELPCLGTGLFGFRNSYYEVWRKTILTPAGGMVWVEKVVVPQGKEGEYYNEDGDVWKSLRWVAPLVRVFPANGQLVINETFSEWLVNDVTGQHAKITGLFKLHYDQNGVPIREAMPILNCNLVGNVPPNQKEWNGAP